MHIQSSRFGSLDIDADQVITFSRGLIGFSGQHRFILLGDSSNERFFWLQSVDDADVAFLLTNPALFFKGYSVAIKDETTADLQLDGSTNANLRTLVICNKVGDWLTGNLLGPIVINQSNLLATQVVLTEKKWTTRQPLAKLTQLLDERLAKAA